MKNEYLEGAEICTAHGVKGQLKLRHLCNSASVLIKQKRVFLKERDGSYSERKVISSSSMGEYVLMLIEGIGSREEAIVLRGKMIYLHRSDIPLAKGEMFIADMIGLPVIHAENGSSLGVISDVSEVTGRRIYTVSYNGQSVLLPDVPEFIKEIDKKEGMRVSPIPGLFDGDADEI